MIPGNYFDNEVLQLRDDLLRLAEEVAAKYIGDRGFKRRVISLLLKHCCERCIIEKLRLGYAEDDEVDGFWRSLHDYGIALLVERLKDELVASDLPVSIVSEADNPVGRYDVLITVGWSGVEVLNGGVSISIEGKVGMSVPLDQIEKYLWNGGCIILVRFLTGEAVRFSAGEWVNFLRFSLRGWISKAKRLLEGRVVLVMGRDCYDCPLKACRFNREKDHERKPTRPRDISEILEDFRENAETAIETAVKLVMKELKAASAEEGME